MNVRLNVVLVYFGLGGFFGFLVVFFGYVVSGDYMVYFIFLGVVVGVVFGMYFGLVGFRVVFVVFLMGGGFYCCVCIFLGLWGWSEKF